MKNFTIYYIILIIALLPVSLFSDGSAGEDASYESRRIIDMPTAGVIPKGTFEVNTFLMQSGGLMTEFAASPFDNFVLGVSFGGSNIIGVSTPSFQDFPGVQIKYRILDETKTFPALALGLNSQGLGLYDKTEERYQTASPGVYISSSKSFKWPVGLVYVHAGINYSLEPKPNDRSVNFYFGAEQTIYKRISIGAEFNANLENNTFFMENNGLLNFQVKWAASENLTVA
ncbi:MAG: YjbH domain-containing protein, partial [Candidatus Kapaibacterium sp.]